MLGYILSLEADKWLFHADILVDKAHVVMLIERGIIKREEGVQILKCLNKIEEDAEDFIKHELPSYEDVHTAIESVMIKEIGEDIGGRMHTARSRNDEVATCIRIKLREALLEIMDEINGLREVLIERSEENTETIMPGYTHLQHAQPTTLAHHLLAHFDAFSRDFLRLKKAYENTNLCPLGAAAFASTAFRIDRDRTAELLGFDGVIENSMDAVSTRDFVIEALSCFANIMTNLSRIAEEIILWSSSEFDFIRIPEEYACGSSIMPQKRNPDYAELVRAKTGTVYGCLMSVLSICKALPYSYNRDLQEITPHLLRATKITSSSINVIKAIIEGMEIKKEEMRKKAGVGFTTATELADTIVRETGIPFRTAHRIVSSLASMFKNEEDTEIKPMEILRKVDEIAMRTIGKKLSELGLTEGKIKEAMEIHLNIEKRDIKGGPAKKEVMRMLQARRSDLERDKKIYEEKERKIKESMQALKREVDKIVVTKVL
ncbi:MAG: argininosuccinate lyase [Candidatus Methanospirareceae archaeon]